MSNQGIKSVLEQEYVYQADETGEFLNAIVSLGVTERETLVTIRPKQNMTFAEVERVLLGFEADVLQRAKMKLEGSYPALLEYKGKTFKIAFDDKRNVKSIERI